MNIFTTKCFIWKNKKKQSECRVISLKQNRTAENFLMPEEGSQPGYMSFMWLWLHPLSHFACKTCTQHPCCPSGLPTPIMLLKWIQLSLSVPHSAFSMALVTHLKIHQATFIYAQKILNFCSILLLRTQGRNCSSTLHLESFQSYFCTLQAMDII